MIGYYRATLAVRKAELAALEAALIPWAARAPPAGLLPGIAELGALTLAAAVVDWRRFPAAGHRPATPTRAYKSA